MRDMTTKVEITRMGREGDGIAFIDGQPLYVPFTVPGDIAEVAISSQNKNSPAQLVRLIKPSNERQQSVCRYFGECGGCALQEWQNAPYQQWKRDLLKQTLVQAGVKAAEAEKRLQPLFSVIPETRRRLVLTASLAGGKISFGFNRSQSHEIIEIDECPVAKPSLVAALPILRRLLTVMRSRRNSFHIVVTEAENGLDIAFQDISDLAEEEKLRLSEFVMREQAKVANNPAAIIHTILRLSTDGETILEKDKPYLFFGAVKVEIPAGGFLQAVAEAEDYMASCAVKALRKNKNIADLFAGCGSFTFRLATQSNVHAVEWDRQALAALNQATHDLASVQAAATDEQRPKFKKITSERRDLFQQPLTYKELADYDAVIFDPPRAGAEAQAQEIAKSQIKTVVSVSCNPTTLARDLQILMEGGFELKSLTPIDQFLWSSHVEAIAVLTKRRPKKSWTL